MKSLNSAIFAVVVFCVSYPASASNLYSVDPVALSGGYAVSGGFIETDSLGSITEANIIDYSINVTGPFPYVFTPLNPGANVDTTLPAGTTAELSASNTSLKLSKQADHSFFVRLRFSASDNSFHPDCVSCDLSVGFVTQVSSGEDVNFVSLSMEDFSDSDPFINVISAGQPGNMIQIGTYVPEPSTFLLACVACGIAIFRRQVSGQN
jgi:hypothetical protein